MSILTLVIILLGIAAVLYFVNTRGAAMNSTIKLIINIALIAVAIISVLDAFGVWKQIKDAQVPKL